MRAPSIRSPGAEPGFDGDINLYTAPEAESLDWFDKDRRVIFVNGMANSPADHAGSARALSLLQGCPVIGVYNKSDGLWPDLGQCITDKAALAGIQAQAPPQSASIPGMPLSRAPSITVRPLATSTTCSLPPCST